MLDSVNSFSSQRLDHKKRIKPKQRVHTGTIGSSLLDDEIINTLMNSSFLDPEPFSQLCPGKKFSGSESLACSCKSYLFHPPLFQPF